MSCTSVGSLVERGIWSTRFAKPVAIEIKQDSQPGKVTVSKNYLAVECGMPSLTVTR
jgi:hypothetical protein